MEALRLRDRIQHARHILSLQSELGAMFVDEMDLLSLIKWRLTCKDNYYQGSSALTRFLANLLRPFVPSPHTLLDLITKYHALFGGEVALAFLLRDPKYRPIHMDIYTSDFEFEPLCDALIDDPRFHDEIEAHIYTNTALRDSLVRLVARTLTIHTKSGKTIHVHRSYTNSAAAPISRAPCTALSNFVTAVSFGCSHPRLTFARRALLADLDIPRATVDQRASLDNLLRQGFSFAVSPAAWVDYRRGYTPGNSDGSASESDVEGAEESLDIYEPEDAIELTQDCWRHMYVCPSQGRFFGDRGSFVDFFDPLGGDETRCEEDCIAPFGPMVMWRIVTSFACDEGCDSDDVLEEGASLIPILIQKDPNGELLDVISDRYMGDCGREYAADD